MSKYPYLFLAGLFIIYFYRLAYIKIRLVRVRIVAWKNHKKTVTTRSVFNPERRTLNL